LFEVVVLSHAIVCYKLEPEINYWTDMFQLYIKVFNSAKMKSANIIIVAHVLRLVSNHNECLLDYNFCACRISLHTLFNFATSKWQGVTSHQCKLPCDFPNWCWIMHQRDLQKRRASMTGTIIMDKKKCPQWKNVRQCIEQSAVVKSFACFFFFG